MFDAHAEISAPDHPAYPVIVGQKRWMLDLFVRLAPDAGAADPAAVGQQVMLLHEGAVVTTGMQAIPEAYVRARDLAVALLESRIGRS